MRFNTYLSEDKKTKQHEKWLKEFQKKGTDLKKLYAKYLKLSLMTKNTEYNAWVEYMNDEIKARK